MYRKKQTHQRQKKDSLNSILIFGFAVICLFFLDSDVEMGRSESSTKVPKTFSVGELVWGPHGTFPSWPGKLVRFERDGSKVLVCWFGNRDTSQVNSHHLKSLSDGLEDHHRERKKLRK